MIRDLVWILLPVLEYSRQYNKQYLLHASAVEINKKGVLIFGPTHSGKTSIAAILGFKYKNKIIGTEHTLIGKEGIDGGTHIMELYSGIKRFIPEIPIPGDDVGWEKHHRVNIDLREKGQYTKKVPLNLIIYPNIIPSSGSKNSAFTHQKWSKRKSKVIFNEQLGWMLNAPLSFIHNIRSKMPSLDTNPEIIKKRIEYVNFIFDKTDVDSIHFIKGTPQQIAEKILELTS